MQSTHIIRTESQTPVSPLKREEIPSSIVPIDESHLTPTVPCGQEEHPGTVVVGTVELVDQPLSFRTRCTAIKTCTQKWALAMKPHQLLSSMKANAGEAHHMHALLTGELHPKMCIKVSSWTSVAQTFKPTTLEHFHYTESMSDNTDQSTETYFTCLLLHLKEKWPFLENFDAFINAP